MRRKTKLQIYNLFAFILTYTVIGFLWEYIEIGKVGIGGSLVGAAVGGCLGLLEESKWLSFTKSLPFTSSILMTSLVYVAVIAVPVLLVGFVFGYLEGRAISEFYEWIFSTEFPAELLLIYSIHLAVSFVRHVNRLLGPGTLYRYMSGRYHRPTEEERVFLFIDMKSSTALAEHLGGKKYFGLLNTFFRDISEPILERDAEIYQYVGDEVILTWPVEAGLRDASCVRVFIELLAHIHSRREYYLSHFGHFPEFKAGLHFGKVITAEIGDLKKEIVYNGDVLNTTSRIQSLCNSYGKKLIASKEIVDVLEMPEFLSPEPLGRIDLRGKADPVELVALA